MTLIGIVALVLALVVSIALHEVGHMVPAKKFGVKVTQYMIGFGPTLWSRTRGDTQYGVKAVLLGGYIRMIGMFPPGSGKASHQGRLGTLIEQAREDSAAEVGPGEEHRTFYNLTVPKKLVVMLGGPVMNLLIAIVLFTVVYAGFGTPTPSTTVDSVTQCVPTASAPDGTCESGGTPTGAASAGLQPGDVIVAWDGQRVSQWSELSPAIRASSGGTHQVTIVRDGHEVTLDVPLSTVDGTLLGESGQRGFLGVSPVVELQPMPVTAVPGQMWDISRAIGRGAGDVSGQDGRSDAGGLHRSSARPGRSCGCGRSQPDQRRGGSCRRACELADRSVPGDRGLAESVLVPVQSAADPAAGRRPRGRGLVRRCPPEGGALARAARSRAGRRGAHAASRLYGCGALDRDERDHSMGRHRQAHPAWVRAS
ncbi:MAG: site-2 protease family protein [Candidatus Nanopelagicales bacterium]